MPSLITPIQLYSSFLKDVQELTLILVGMRHKAFRDGKDSEMPARGARQNPPGRHLPAARAAHRPPQPGRHDHFVGRLVVQGQGFQLRLGHRQGQPPGANVSRVRSENTCMYIYIYI